MAKSAWTVDATHSEIGFSVKHMMFAKVRGTFQQFAATVEADPANLTDATIEFSVDTASVDTRNEDRDKHLRSADFFDVENHPQMTFKANKIMKKGDGEYEMVGDLTVRGTTHPETFMVAFGGQGKNPWGQEVAVFNANGSINRGDYGLQWNAALETGGVLVSDQVQIEIELEAKQQA